MEVKDKVAIVTGVSRGIGLFTVKILLEAGMKVAGWSRTKPEIVHDNFEFFETDVQSLEQVEKSVEDTTSYFNKNPSVLINNAGVGFEGPLADLDPEHWHTMFRTNVDGTFYCIKVVLPYMQEADEGHIINIASIAGTMGVPNMAAYSATKHAVRGLSHSLFKEVRDNGIKVTCIYPGSVKTHFFDDIGTITAHDHMMRPEDLAGTILQCLQTHPNYHVVDLEVRPLRPKG